MKFKCISESAKSVLLTFKFFAACEEFSPLSYARQGVFFGGCRPTIAAAPPGILDAESRIKTLLAHEIQTAFGLWHRDFLRSGLGQNSIGFLEPVAWSVLRSTQPPNWPYLRFHRLVLSGPLDTLSGAPLVAGA